MDDHERFVLRRMLYEQFGPAAVAMSADGRSVQVATPLEAGLQIGGVALVVGEDPSQPVLVVQVRNAQIVERDGPELDVAGPTLEAMGGISTGTIRPMMRYITGSGVVLGTLIGTDFTRLDHVDPFGERFVRPATADEIGTIFEGFDHGDASIEIGVLSQATHVPARLRTKGFARHTFMCGQSGSGKTYTTGGLFERLLAGTTLPIVVLDPNSDHVRLAELRDPLDTSDEAERFRAVASTVRVARARGLDGSYTLCADFSDLVLDWQALLLRLHPVDDADEFDALARITATLTAPYSAHDMLDQARTMTDGDPFVTAIVRRMTNLRIADWDVWRVGDEVSIVKIGLREQRCVIFDIGSLTRPDERAAVALSLLGSRWAQRAKREPVLIAIDEAHNVLPAATSDPLLQAITDLGTLIAGEGRKFGLHLFVATQRPAKVHPNVVSQCDNLLLMRMNGSGDIDDLVTLFSHVPEPMLRQAVTFGLGQALVAGPISPIPMMVQIGGRLSLEGGGDLPTTWATPPS
jgi:uncharacterized protein